MSLSSIYEWENELGSYHCPEYSQQHTDILLLEICCLSGSCFSCLCSTFQMRTIVLISVHESKVFHAKMIKERLQRRC